MTVEIILFVLRLVSGAILLGIMGVLFLALWRDYQSAIVQTQAQRRIYGRLVEVTENDENYADTEVYYPLLPLTSIGRAPTNTIPLNDDFASGEHALVALRNGQWWLEDRQSRNGTLINGLPIHDPIVITDGDIIGVGHRRFRVELE